MTKQEIHIKLHELLLAEKADYKVNKRFVYFLIDKLSDLQYQVQELRDFIGYSLPPNSFAYNGVCDTSPSAEDTEGT